MLISHHGQPLAAGLQKTVMWPLSATHLQLYCYLVTVPRKSLTKSSKFSLKKGPVMSVPCLNGALYTLSLTVPWLAWCDLVLCVEERLLFVTATPNIHIEITPSATWTFIPGGVRVNSHAFSILMQPFRKTLNHHALYLFIFFRVSPPPLPWKRHGCIFM